MYFHQGYVSNAYPCLHVVKEQIFISSAKHTPGAYHPKIFCWILLTSDHITQVEVSSCTKKSHKIVWKRWKCHMTIRNGLFDSVILCGNECYFYNETFGIERYARHESSVRIENSVPRDHCFASLGTASWCQIVTLGTEFSICTSRPCKILIVSTLTRSFLIGSLSNLQVTRSGIRSQTKTHLQAEKKVKHVNE